MNQTVELNEHDIDDHAGFRRLRANELVSRGDFVADDHQALEPWDGPTGFRADAFVKPVYRRSESASPAISELK
jgi:hypothetical protein